MQAGAMYAINQIFFLYANFNVLDLEVNADFGLVGVNKIDRYPSILYCQIYSMLQITTCRSDWILYWLF
jgi:hypothetical protein